MSVELDKRCRACLNKKGRIQHIFTPKIRKMIEFCSSITISESDNLPRTICDICFRRLQNSFAFKKMMQRNEKILRDLSLYKIDSKDASEINMKTKVKAINRTHALITSEPPPLAPIYSKMIKSNVTSNNTCTICQTSFDNRAQLLLHLRNHDPSSTLSLQHPVVKKRYKCLICDKRYNHHSSLRLHLYVHTGEKHHKCPICGKQFARWAGVTSHMLTHSMQRAHVCPICGRGFKVRSNMERHKLLHTGIAPYCCNVCGKSFNQSNNFTLHMQTHHSNERLHLCYICGKRFVCSSRLKRHVRIHNVEAKSKERIHFENTPS